MLRSIGVLLVASGLALMFYGGLIKSTGVIYAGVVMLVAGAAIVGLSEEYKKSTAKILAYIGAIFGAGSCLPGHVIIGFDQPMVSYFFGFPAIIFGLAALTKASKEERTICYVAIGLGIIGAVVWTIVS